MKKLYFLFLVFFATLNANCQGFWDGGGGDGQWTTATNWDDDLVPNSAIPVMISGGVTVTVASGIVEVCNSVYVEPGNTLIINTDLTVISTFYLEGTSTVSTASLIVDNFFLVGTLTVGQGSTLDVNSSFFSDPGSTFSLLEGSVNIEGNFFKDGDLPIKGDVGTTQGSIVVAGTIFNSSGSTSYTQHYNGAAFPAARRYYVSSPFADAVSGVFAASGANKLFSYDESTLSYAEITGDATTLNSTQGYVFRSATTADYTMTSGSFFQNDDVTTPVLSYTGADPNTGYNLIGNPYPAAYDWELATLTNVSTTYAIKTTTALDVPVNDTYNGTSHVGSNNNGSGALTKYIAPTQGFWVQATAAAGTVGFLKTGRVAHNVVAARSADQSLIRLNLTNGITSDQLVVNFNADAGENFDAFDSEKMFLNTVPEIYTQVEDKQLVINTLPVVTENTIVPLTLTIPTDGEFDFKLEEISGVFNDFNVFIVDKLNETVNMVNDNEMYHFASVAGLSSGRFDLVFSNSLSAGIHTAEIQKISMYNVNSTVHINLNGLEKGEANVYDVAGRKVGAYNLDNNTNQFELQEGAGVYTVEVLSGLNRKTQKIVIQ
jgi:trimeric autotransporter adhesin